MRHASRWAATTLLVAGGLALSGCSTSGVGAAAAGREKPATVETVAGTAVKKVTLTDQAVARLGIRTAPATVRTVPGPAGSGGTRITVPYSALLYDTAGDTWVFEATGPRAYQRRKVDVEVVDGETVVMTSGPAPGTAVVTVGAAVLYGTELGTGA